MNESIARNGSAFFCTYDLLQAVKFLILFRRQACPLFKNSAEMGLVGIAGQECGFFHRMILMKEFFGFFQTVAYDIFTRGFPAGLME